MVTIFSLFLIQYYDIYQSGILHKPYLNLFWSFAYLMIFMQVSFFTVPWIVKESSFQYRDRFNLIFIICLRPTCVTSTLTYLFFYKIYFMLTLVFDFHSITPGPHQLRCVWITWTTFLDMLDLIIHFRCLIFFSSLFFHHLWLFSDIC